MATKTSGPAVTHKVLPGGSEAIGAVIDGVFVPFAQLDSDYVKGLVETGKSEEYKAAYPDGEGEGE